MNALFCERVHILVVSCTATYEQKKSNSKKNVYSWNQSDGNGIQYNPWYKKTCKMPHRYLIVGGGDVVVDIWITKRVSLERKIMIVKSRR